MTDAAAWAAAEHATQVGRDQLALLLNEQSTVKEIVARFGNLGPSQREGHVFEWAHELTFNLNAIANHDDARLRVTTWLGEPHAPDDLRIYGSPGEVLGRVQAKVVGDVAHRVSADHGLSAEKYHLMSRLVPSDHVDSTARLLDARLEMPESRLTERYEDVRTHLTDHISHGRSSSAPMSTEELKRAGADPEGLLQHLVNSDQLIQLVAAGGAAAATGAVVSGLLTLSGSRIRLGSFDDMPWTEAARRAAAAAVRSGSTVIAGQGLSLIAQHALAEGATSGLSNSLAGGTLPYALARGAFDIAIISHGVATGRLSPTEAAVAAAESITRTSAVWACAAVGQAAIPIPVVGALVGGLVGQYGAVMIIQGVRLAVSARDMSAEWDREYELLLQRTYEAEEAAKGEVAKLHERGDRYDTAFRDLVLPKLDIITTSLGTSRPDEVLVELADLTQRYAGTPLFTSIPTFETFMADRGSVLVLNLGC